MRLRPLLLAMAVGVTLVVVLAGWAALRPAAVQREPLPSPIRITTPSAPEPPPTAPGPTDATPSAPATVPASPTDVVLPPPVPDDDGDDDEDDDVDGGDDDD
ncbi:hypothetical protein [Blastococcus sp. PRF04-17]|uniref:hypothetical protein n=1 Tax=Blastococcus sp. PRF04-17 TaxID=2933797 RepID=UPI001FF39ED0|nr:hypothetical protein [Blastococcus sp. PRF04-17]UOY03607.1 hypothetical protein MVA48_09865 [Blastococcus sp. PRF04-17]